jgi:mercuric ion transport protein
MAGLDRRIDAIMCLVTVQLLYLPDCPNVDPARAVLRAAMAAAGVSVPVEEIDTTAADVPEWLRHWGSPTILVDGMDVAGEVPSGGQACRVYDCGGALSGVPSVALVRAAIESSRAREI